MSSFAQRFAASRSSQPESEGRRMIPMGGGGGGPSEAIYEPRPEAGWTQVGRSNPFSRPERRPAASGQSYSDYKKKKEEPKPLRVDDDEAFPTLGSKPRAVAAPKASGFAAMAASWAAKDAAEAAEERRRQQEDEEERQKREREQRTTFMPRIFRASYNPSGGSGGAVYQPDYEDEMRPYSPHSPSYDPYYDDDEEGPAEPYEEPIRRNAVLDGGDEDNDGWVEQER